MKLLYDNSGAIHEVQTCLSKHEVQTCSIEGERWRYFTVAEAATIEIGSTKRRGSDGNILHENQY